MSSASRFSSVVLGALLLAIAGPVFAGSTAYTDTDNENNAGTGVADGDMDVTVGRNNPLHPIEFNVNVVAVPTTSAVITLRAFDVDEEQGEQDDVYLNNVKIGELSGANNVWNATTFTIDLQANPGLIVAGNNRIRVQVDVGDDGWTTNIDWAQMLLDGGARDQGRTESIRITDYSIAGPTVTINTQTSITSITGGTYRVEVSVIDPTGNTGSVLTQDVTAAPNEPVTLNLAPTYPLNGVSGTYTIQAQLFFIDNSFPVQQDLATAQFVHAQGAGPTDTDNDGIPDALERGPGPGSQDTDGDGIPDFLDRDSDGDGLPDAIEAGGNPATPVDTDEDGTPDYLDLDSDGDGLPDRLEGGSSGTDTDGDGIDDAFDVDTAGGVDLDGDGVSDTAAPASTDPDGVPDYLDPDSDGDGILDTLEGNATGTDTDNDGIDNAMDVDATGGTDANGDGIDDAYVFPDTDADGIPDFRDLDADNDGVPDVTEGGRVDADGNGLLDPGQTAGNSATDTDGDTTPDFRERDSDGDSLFDAYEAGGLDPDGDGLLEPFVDLNGNGLADRVDPAAGGAPLPLTDTDGDEAPDYQDLDSDADGISDAVERGPGPGARDTDGDSAPDHRDLDSDGDGLSDLVEGVTDTDGDGTPDYLDQPGKLVSAINGAGSVDLWVLLALGGALLWRRRRQVALVAVAVSGLTMGTAANSAEPAVEPDQWYLGADLAFTRLEPEDRGGGYVVDDDSSSGFRLVGGYVFNDRWSLEAFYLDAGEAGIASQNSAVGHLGELEYTLYGLGAEWAPLRGHRYRKFYPALKFGLAATSNSATDDRIDYDQENNWSVYFGAAGIWRVSDQWRAQLEAMSYDEDELAFSIGVRRTFR